MEKQKIQFISDPASGKAYCIVGELGAGNFGKVYSGFDSNGRSCAVKILDGEKEGFSPTIERFVNEATSLSRLSHPNIVGIENAFITDSDLAVIVMEKGITSLSKSIEAGIKYSPLDVLDVGIQLLSALDQVHSLGIIHRDVTPSNVLSFSDGIWKLCDFGLSATGTSVSTPAYIRFKPPEHIQQGFACAQSDLYQLGLTLLEMLLGEKIIRFENDPNLMHSMITSGMPRMIAERTASKKGATGEVAALLAVMLRRRLEYRFQNAGDAIGHFELIKSRLSFATN